MSDKRIDNFQIETPYGWVDFDGIRRMPEKQRLYKVALEDGYCIETTSKHKFVVDNKTIEMSTLKEGDFLETVDGLKKVTSIEDTGNEDWVYDILHVNNEHHSFFANGILHHNCSFIGSTVTLVEGSHLKRLNKHIQEEPLLPTPNMDYYGKVRSNGLYVFAVDVSKGVGRDYSIIQVVDISDPRLWKQVAVYFDNFVDPFNLTNKIIELAGQWNNPYIIVEVNAYGDEVVRRLWHEHEYENLFWEKKQNGRKGHGVYADVRTKAIATSMFKKHVENKMIMIPDKKTVKEIEGFVELRPDIYGCEEGENNFDDRVMAMVWFSYFMESTYWQDLEPYVRDNYQPDINKENSSEQYSAGNQDMDVFEPIVVENPSTSDIRDEDGFVWSKF